MNDLGIANNFAREMQQAQQQQMNMIRMQNALNQRQQLIQTMSKYPKQKPLHIDGDDTKPKAITLSSGDSFDVK